MGSSLSAIAASSGARPSSLRARHRSRAGRRDALRELSDNPYWVLSRRALPMPALPRPVTRFGSRGRVRAERGTVQGPLETHVRHLGPGHHRLDTPFLPPGLPVALRPVGQGIHVGSVHPDHVHRHAGARFGPSVNVGGDSLPRHLGRLQRPLLAGCVAVCRVPLFDLQRPSPELESGRYLHEGGWCPKFGRRRTATPLAQGGAFTAVVSLGRSLQIVLLRVLSPPYSADHGSGGE